MSRFVKIETKRNGYSPEQCGPTFTVRELIEYLENFDAEVRVYFSNDNGYTFGNILPSQIEEDYYGEDDDDDFDEEDED